MWLPRVRRPAAPAPNHALRGKGPGSWDFVDTARYRDLRLPLTVTVATCAPDDPLQPRVLSWGFLDRDLTWHVDAVLSTTRPREARAAVEELVGTFRLR